MTLAAVDVSSYLPVLLLIVMAIGFAVGNIVLTRIIGPSRGGKVKGVT
jgi:NADH:ubiquinone oxidoreductase subunit 3 (subunit A)